MQAALIDECVLGQLASFQDLNPEFRQLLVSVPGEMTEGDVLYTVKS